MQTFPPDAPVHVALACSLQSIGIKIYDDYSPTKPKK